MKGCRSTIAVAMFVAALTVAGCGSTPRPAPVIDRMPEGSRAGKPRAPVPAAEVRETDPRPGSYSVRRGDTLYAIALDHGLDYRELAAWNRLENPNRIFVGQTLRLTPPGSGVPAIASSLPGVPDRQGRAAPVSGPVESRSGDAVRDGVVVEPKAVKLPYSEQALARLKGSAPVVAGKPVPESGPAVVEARPSTEGPKPAPRASVESPPPAAAAPASEEGGLGWLWPTQGRVVSGFSEARALKGLDIAGSTGQSVVASAAGRVVYVGDSLRGYGNLVIIKHNETFLSAYAHNRQILVKEGQSVSRGQKIAEMGSSDADQVKLHFQIRRYGKPVDPTRYLPLS